MRIRDKLSCVVWLFNFTPDDPEEYSNMLAGASRSTADLIDHLVVWGEYMLLFEAADGLYALRCIHQGGQRTGAARNIALSYRSESLIEMLVVAAVQADLLRERRAFYGSAPKERWQVIS